MMPRTAGRAMVSQLSASARCGDTRWLSRQNPWRHPAPMAIVTQSVRSNMGAVTLEISVSGYL